uniref:NmrA-like domain-containing protein n=1 Tax=Bionectria ochroleuca TaxID=29856 RepID=A0A0B7K5L8_BIOOC
MPNRRIFVVGATGAQGLPVCRGLVKDGAYSLRVLTRNANSSRAKQLAELGDVEFLEGTFASNEDLRNGLKGCWGAFINIDGFNCGEKTETYWTIRAYELAVETGIKFFVFGNLDYVYKKSGYDPRFRCGHYDGKGRMAEWILSQRKGNDMGVAIFTTGPYMEMTIASQTPMTPRYQDGVVLWVAPLGDGAVPHVSLDDCEHYVRWLFDHPERSDGMDLEVAINHIRYADLAAAFQKVTGKPAQYINVPMSRYIDRVPISHQPAAYNADPSDPATMTFEENFTGFWTMWAHSGGNQGVITRNYQLLDEIHPKRIRTAEEFFRREEERRRSLGIETLFEAIQKDELKSVLKLGEDNRNGRFGRYRVRALTRNLESPRAKLISDLPNVTLVRGSQDNQEDLHNLFRGAHGAWVNLDGFTLGEKDELFYGFRAYEIARSERVQHYVWANIEYALENAGFDERFHCGHMDSKGRVGKFILSLGQDGMKSTLFSTGPYMDMLIGGLLVPREQPDGTFAWVNPARKSLDLLRIIGLVHGVSFHTTLHKVEYIR